MPKESPRRTRCNRRRGAYLCIQQGYCLLCASYEDWRQLHGGYRAYRQSFQYYLENIQRIWQTYEGEAPGITAESFHTCMNISCFQNLFLSELPAPRPLYRERAELKLYLIVKERSRVSNIFFTAIELRAS